MRASVKFCLAEKEKKIAKKYNRMRIENLYSSSIERRWRPTARVTPSSGDTLMKIENVFRLKRRKGRGKEGGGNGDVCEY